MNIEYFKRKLWFLSSQLNYKIVGYLNWFQFVCRSEYFGGTMLSTHGTFKIGFHVQVEKKRNRARVRKNKSKRCKRRRRKIKASIQKKKTMTHKSSRFPLDLHHFKSLQRIIIFFQALFTHENSKFLPSLPQSLWQCSVFGHDFCLIRVPRQFYCFYGTYDASDLKVSTRCAYFICK